MNIHEYQAKKGLFREYGLNILKGDVSVFFK